MRNSILFINYLIYSFSLIHLHQESLPILYSFSCAYSLFFLMLFHLRLAVWKTYTYMHVFDDFLVLKDWKVRL
jgi:hypothetical protein